jgi:tetratricopeptide (TPR) repeat protein
MIHSPAVSKLASLFLLITAPLLVAQTLDVQKALRDRYLEPVRRLLTAGEYERVSQVAVTILDDGEASPEYFRILAQALTALGRADEAIGTVQLAQKTHPEDLAIAMLVHDTLGYFGRRDKMAAALDKLNTLAKSKPSAKLNADELVALGRAALVAGADPQLVINRYLEPAKKKDPKAQSSYLALGELALEKGDYQRAMKEFTAGLKEHGEDPQLRVGLARAFAPSDRGVSQQHLKRALEINPRSVPALVLQAEHWLSGEKFTEAEQTLTAALEVDPLNTTAWVMKSVLATLAENDPFSANNHRTKALERWPQNPEVDHLIGKALSRAYRFPEGAQHQRESLAMDPRFLRAKLQLASDLMRLGETADAWKLAAEIRTADAYNTQAHNLGLLEREMSGFHVQKESDFILKMPLRDWQVFGTRALEILREARQVLAPKYGLQPELMRPTVVEFFPSQQDFAIRTFGSLGGQGLLGVCFGTVITMNSPGSLAAGRNNWEATLWHEFCHVVTLSTTHNRMPRWLSEGISVYEEGQRDPAWGMPMTADWRERILNEEEPPLPLSQLSGAFMNAKDSEAMMFAYFQSAQAVEYLIQAHGLEKLRALLADLANGTRINGALANHIAPIEQLDAGYHAALVAAAKAYAPKADFSRPSRDELKANSLTALTAFLKLKPNNLAALRSLIAAQMEAEDWTAAATTAQKLYDLEPLATGADSGLWLRAKALHRLEKHEDERLLLEEVADKAADAVIVFQRLLELEQGRQNWRGVQKAAGRLYALNPFLPQTTQSLAMAEEELGNVPLAAQHNERLLLLKPPNPAVIHHKLATLYRSTDAKLAKRHLLDALAMAPRWPEALALLLEFPE